MRVGDSKEHAPGGCGNPFGWEPQLCYEPIANCFGAYTNLDISVAGHAQGVGICILDVKRVAGEPVLTKPSLGIVIFLGVDPERNVRNRLLRVIAGTECCPFCGRSRVSLMASFGILVLLRSSRRRRVGGESEFGRGFSEKFNFYNVLVLVIGLLLALP